MAWRGDVDESLDSYIAARAGAIRFAQMVNLVIDALTKR